MHFHRHFIAQEVAVSRDEERAVVLGSTQHSCASAVRHAVELGNVQVAVAGRVRVAVVFRAVNAAVRGHVHCAMRGVVVHEDDFVHVGVHAEVEPRSVERCSGLLSLLVGS